MRGEGKGLKLPKKLLQQQKAREEQKHRDNGGNDSSDDDFFDKGVDEEISGDRWLGSDVVKALRAYQRAYFNYLECVARNPMHYEARYNIAGLLFTVYNNYIKNEGVRFSEFTSCEDALSGLPTAVVKSLPVVVDYFEKTVDFFYSIDATTNEEIQWTDLFFNAGLCFTEFIEYLSNGNKDTDDEEDDDEGKRLDLILTYTIKSRNLFTKVLDRYTDSLVSHNENHDRESLAHSILETLANMYKLFTASYESVSQKADYDLIFKESSETISKCDYISDNLIHEYHRNSNVLTNAEIDELTMSRINLKASQAETFDALSMIWSSDNVQILDQSQMLEKTLLEAESYRTLLQKYNDNAETQLGDDTKWQVLSKTSVLFKTCHDIVKSELDEIRKQKFNQNDKTSKLISQLASILIERADIDVQRAALNTEKALQLRETLRKNCVVCLKNAVIYAQQSGGLLETSGEKLLRAKKRNEALIRLCVVENKSSEDELTKIMGSREIWTSELQELAEQGIYNVGNMNM